MDFEGGHPIEGAKEVSTVMTRHVSRALRLQLHRRRAPSPEQRQRATAAWKERLEGLLLRLPKQLHVTGSSAVQRAAEPVGALHLRIDPSRRTLEVV